MGIIFTAPGNKDVVFIDREQDITPGFVTGEGAAFMEKYFRPRNIMIKMIKFQYIIPDLIDHTRRDPILGCMHFNSHNSVFNDEE